MSSNQHEQQTWYGPGTYRIRVRGSLRTTWSDRLAGMRIRPDESDPDCTVLEGPLPDQAALLGVLKGLYDLGRPLLLVECVQGEGWCPTDVHG
jgi:hypothetical protein